MRIFNLKQTEYFQILNLFHKKDKLKLLAVSIIQIFLSLLDLLGIALFGLIGSVTVSAISGKSLTGRTANFVNLLGIENLTSQFQVLCIGLFATLLMMAKTATALYLNKKIIFFLSKRGAVVTANLTGNLFKKSFTEIKERSGQKLIYTLTSGVDNLTVKILGSSVVLISDLVLLIVLIIGLLLVDLFTTLVIFILFGFISISLYILFRKRNKNLGELSSKYGIKSSKKIYEAIGTYRELSLRGQRQHAADEIGRARMSQADAVARVAYLSTFNKYVMEAAVIFIAMFIAGLQFLLNDALHSITVLTLFFVAISRIAPATLRIQQNLLIIKNSLGQARPTLDLIKSLRISIYQTSSVKVPAKIPTSYLGFSGKVSIKNLSFKYVNNDQFAVSNLNLELKPGNLIAIVGPSGAGKSTLVDLLLGLHEPTSGHVMIDDIPASISITRWPGAIAYVPQDIQIIQGSISKNVLLGFEDSTENKELVKEVLIKAELREYIKDSKIQEIDIGGGGGRLSGGQRQRIGIARALLTNPRILVFDEATSSLDAQTESKLTKIITETKNNNLVIVVAHRLATVRKADLVVYLEGGQIKATGSFEEVRKLIPDFEAQAKFMGL